MNLAKSVEDEDPVVDGGGGEETAGDDRAGEEKHEKFLHYFLGCCFKPATAAFNRTEQKEYNMTWNVLLWKITLVKWCPLDIKFWSCGHMLNADPGYLSNFSEP